MAWSLTVCALRRRLTEIGQTVGTPVVFLKAAWADPVLYGGSGQRTGADVDVLVSAGRFDVFASALLALGYRRDFTPTHPVMSFTGKEATFTPGDGKGIAIDLHRALANAPFFALPADACLARAIHYPSPDGPVLSLSPADQVLYAAVHYANHGPILDRRHVNDIVRLLSRSEIDWPALRAQARRGGFALPFAWLAGELRRAGAALPPVAPSPTRSQRLRLMATESLGRSRVLSRPAFYNYRVALARGLLSNRVTALPRFIAWYVRTRFADHVALRSNPRQP